MQLGKVEQGIIANGQWQPARTICGVDPPTAIPAFSVLLDDDRPLVFLPPDYCATTSRLIVGALSFHAASVRPHIHHSVPLQWHNTIIVSIGNLESILQTKHVAYAPIRVTAWSNLCLTL
jgi:hypothetical protein